MGCEFLSHKCEPENEYRLEECGCAAAESGGTRERRRTIDPVRAHVRDVGHQDHSGEFAEIGPGPGLDDNGSTGPAEDVTAHETDIREIVRRILAGALSRA